MTTGLRTILVGYDGSDVARRALGRAAEIVAEGARIVVLHATPSGDAAKRETADPAEEGHSAVLLEEAKALLARRGRTPETRTALGDAAEQLVAAATDTNADVIVVGRRRAPTAHVLGSVSAKVVEQAGCDVFVVR
jgi:nucleotide-binding universal stress UspA family protein